MKLLVVTQAVDREHPNLGFFVRWIEEFAKHADEVMVIANEIGRYSLPKNVQVYGLGKEYGSARIKRYIKFLALIVWFSRSYDSVFCHMNPEFVLAGGWWWCLTGKRLGLWYVHGTVSDRLKAAMQLVHVAFTTNKESLRLESPKIRIVGHGIDTAFFCPSTTPREDTVLSVGRLTESKHHDLVIRAAKKAGKHVRIAGEGPEREALEKLARDSGARVTFLGGITQKVLRDEYRRAGWLIHTSTTGSMDKVVLEALACDTPVISTSMTYATGWPVISVDATEDALAHALTMPVPGNRPDIVRANHSLEKLIPKIISGLLEGT